jgi:hypothetical protein
LIDAIEELWLIRLVSLLSSSWVKGRYDGLQGREIVLLVARDQVVEQRAVLNEGAEELDGREMESLTG